MRSGKAGRLLTMAGQEHEHKHLEGLCTIPRAVDR